jgi:phage baseplate assembly protein W
MPTYTDIDLSFGIHPITKDVLKKNDLESARQAIRRIFFTEQFEKPFDPYFGLGIRKLLFEQNDATMKPIVMRKITEQFINYDPRLVLDDLDFLQTDNGLDITVYFHVIGIAESQKVNFTLERVR